MLTLTAFLILFKNVDLKLLSGHLTYISDDTSVKESIRIIATFSVILFSRSSLVCLKSIEFVLKTININLKINTY